MPSLGSLIISVLTYFVPVLVTYMLFLGSLLYTYHDHEGGFPGPGRGLAIALWMC